MNQKQARSSMIVVGTIAAVFVAFYFFAIATGQVDTGSGWSEIFVLGFFWLDAGNIILFHILAIHPRTF